MTAICRRCASDVFHVNVRFTAKSWAQPDEVVAGQDGSVSVKLKPLRDRKAVEDIRDADLKSLDLDELVCSGCGLRNRDPAEVARYHHGFKPGDFAMYLPDGGRRVEIEREGKGQPGRAEYRSRWTCPTFVLVGHDREVPLYDLGVPELNPHQLNITEAA